MFTPLRPKQRVSEVYTSSNLPVRLPRHAVSISRLKIFCKPNHYLLLKNNFRLCNALASCWKHYFNDLQITRNRFPL